MIDIAYSAEELGRFREVAGRPVWDAWVADMEKQGMPGKELLDFVLRAAASFSS